MKNLVSLIPEQTKEYFLVIHLELKDTTIIIKRLQIFFECIDVVTDEACRNPKQVTSAKEDDNDEDDEFFPISNQNEIEEETNEASEENTSNREKAPSGNVQKNHPESQILGEKGYGV